MPAAVPLAHARGDAGFRTCGRGSDGAAYRSRTLAEMLVAESSNAASGPGSPSTTAKGSISRCCGRVVSFHNENPRNSLNAPSSTTRSRARIAATRSVGLSGWVAQCTQVSG